MRESGSLELDGDELRERVERMTARLRHRGPDDHDVMVCPRSGLALGHRRLSVLDLSPAGRQPMASASGRFHLTYNGEVYNHREIREELQRDGVEFRGACDSEALVEAIDRWGIVETTRRVVGMFAFAAWDRECAQLTLVRDRLGIKPLYYARLNGGWAFASELKASEGWRLPGRRSVHGGAVQQFLRYGYVPALRLRFTRMPRSCHPDAS